MKSYLNRKLIVIEGVDGSGKHTQAVNIQKRIGGNSILVSFPRYGENSANMVEKYLSGTWSETRKELSPIITSDFFSIDRSISYANDAWGEIYDNGGIVIADRYTQANVIHQGCKILFGDSKITDKYIDHVLADQCRDYIKWLYNHEYNDFKIPVPNMVFFLYMDKESNKRIIEQRMKDDPSHADIHEKNAEYMEHCRRMVNILKNDRTYIEDLNAKYNIRYIFINESNEDGSLRSIDEITDEIMEHIIKGE